MGLSAIGDDALIEMGMPVSLGLFVILTEFLGSLALICGVFARVASGAIILLMAVAVAMVHAQFGFYMNWFGQQKGEGFEYHLLAIGLAVAVLVRGAGALSIDGLLRNSNGALNPTGTLTPTAS
jgi:putative oxidoreductase